MSFINLLYNLPLFFIDVLFQAIMEQVTNVTAADVYENIVFNLIRQQR